MLKPRQLAAIMFTDIVGYTAMMSRDEEQALESLRKSRSIQQKYIKDYRGTLLKEMGDGILAKFNSAKEAVLCASAIQEEAHKQLNASIRIGVHLGDVTIENDDIFGDGVNIASRLQSSADPGGIYISDSVFKAVQAISEIQAIYLGEIEYKNVEYPVSTYALQGGVLPVASKKTPVNNSARTTTFYKSIIVFLVLSRICGNLFLEPHG